MRGTERNYTTYCHNIKQASVRVFLAMHSQFLRATVVQRQSSYSFLMKAGLTFLPLKCTVFGCFQLTKTGFKKFFRNQSGARIHVLDVLLVLEIPLPLTLPAIAEVPPDTEQSHQFTRAQIQH